MDDLQSPSTVCFRQNHCVPEINSDVKIEFGTLILGIVVTVHKVSPYQILVTSSPRGSESVTVSDSLRKASKSRVLDLK